MHILCVSGPVACLSLMRHRNALTEKAWKDARTGTGKKIGTFNSRYYEHQYNTGFFLRNLCVGGITLTYPLHTPISI